MRAITVLLAGVLCLCTAHAQLEHNGSFERGAKHWALGIGAQVVETNNAPDGSHILKCSGSGSAKQTIFVQPNLSQNVSIWISTDDIVPATGSGYAFAAIYEFDGDGKQTSFRDFAQQVGTRKWQQYKTTWAPRPNTLYAEIRCGIYNATGNASFDNLQVSASGLGATAQPTRDLALIVNDAKLPANPGAADVAQLISALTEVGYRTKCIDGAQLADRNQIASWLSQTSILVLPNAVYFPADAQRNLILLLSSGADLMTFGGYAFDQPLITTQAGYTPPEKINTRPQLLSPPFLNAPWTATSRSFCKTEKDRLAIVEVPERDHPQAAGWHCDLKATEGETYRLSGQIKTENVKDGYAYVAYYPYAGKKWVQPHDILDLKGSNDWQQFSSTFTVPLTADRVSIRCGLFNATGTARFEDVKLEKITVAPRINTHYGEPHDGLNVSPMQIGMFDADYPLRQAEHINTVAPFLKPWETSSPISGWAATGVLSLNARWQPLLNATDKYGRLRGAAGALMEHYAGPFAGSRWAFFGVTNRDLTALHSFRESVIIPLLQHLQRSTYLHSFKCEEACYRPQEKVTTRIKVNNDGIKEVTGQILFRLDRANASNKAAPLWTHTQPVRVASDDTQEVACKLDAPRLSEGLYRVSAQLRINNQTIDEMNCGFVLWDGQTFSHKEDFRFEHNYFWLRGKRTFLHGTDMWGNWFSSPSQSDPLFWWQQLTMCRDFGVHVPENLQGVPDNHELSESKWRQIDAMLYLSHQAGLVYMAGLLIGKDVAVTGEELQQQERFVAEFAKRYRNADGLIYYLNGDYRLTPKTPEQRELAWQIKQTSHWNESLVKAIRAHDPKHPITSEYYQRPHGGLDLRLTLDELSVANIGYFDEPLKDLLRFPSLFKLIDMRLYGQSLNVGEFGVKTHPAWEKEFGARGYHLRRTELQQRQLFGVLPHYVFGLGGSKIQNWCWRDDDDQVFPWGLVHQCDSVERDVLKTYRAASLLLGRFEPTWRKPEVLLIVADSNRTQDTLGNAWRAALTAAETLINLRADFAVASDLRLTKESLEGVKVVFLPGVQTIPPQSEIVLKRFVETGGVLYRSSAKSWETEAADVGQTTVVNRNEYLALLQKGRVSTLQIEPDSLTLHGFRIPLRNGQAVVFVNASDKAVSFTASVSSDISASMTLGPWQPGFVAMDTASHVLAVEGSGRITVKGEVIAEANGLFSLYSQDDSDVRVSDKLVCLPADATAIRVNRKQPKNATHYRIGEWRNGKWRTLQETKAKRSNGSVEFQIPENLLNEVVLIGNAKGQ